MLLMPRMGKIRRHRGASFQSSVLAEEKLPAVRLHTVPSSRERFEIHQSNRMTTSLGRRNRHSICRLQVNTQFWPYVNMATPRSSIDT